MKEKIKNMIDKIQEIKAKRIEIRKIKDKRRKKIYNSYKLSQKQKKEIDVFYKKNYGKKIPYFWHMHNYAFSNRFDVKYFPELLYIPYFEKYMNNDKAFSKFLEDKNNLYMIRKYLDVKIPDKIVSCQSGIYMNCDDKIIDRNQAILILKDIGEVFFKISTDTDSGNGCAIMNIKNGIDIISSKRIEHMLETIGDNFIIQKIIKCHDTISKINPTSVNTFRIITYRWKNDIYHCPCLMRIGRNGSFVDNAHAGGIFIHIHDDGQFHEKAFTEFKKEYYGHPDSFYKFKENKIELFPIALNKCIEMHKKLPNVGVLNWDVTIDENGEVVLIEINVNGGSIWLSQLSSGMPAFGNNTEEILQWISTMQKTEIKDRKKHLYGRR